MLSFLGWELCIAAHLQHQASDYLHFNGNQNENIKSKAVLCIFIHVATETIPGLASDDIQFSLVYSHIFRPTPPGQDPEAAPDFHHHQLRGPTQEDALKVEQLLWLLNFSNIYCLYSFSFWIKMLEIWLNLNCRAPHPVPACLVPSLSLTHPLLVPYSSLTHLASLGLSRSHKGTGTDTILLSSPSRPSLFGPFPVPYPSLTRPLPVPYPSSLPRPL